MKKKMLNAVAVVLIMAGILSSCEEQHYYRTNHKHSEGYDHRHHRGARVDVDIHN